MNLFTIELSRVQGVVDNLNKRFDNRVPVKLATSIGAGGDVSLSLIDRSSISEEIIEKVDISIGDPNSKGHFRLICELEKVIYKDEFGKQFESLLLNIGVADVVEILKGLSKLFSVAQAAILSSVILCLTDSKITALSGTQFDAAVGQTLAYLALGDAGITQSQFNATKGLSGNPANLAKDVAMANNSLANVTNAKHEYQLAYRLTTASLSNLAETFKQMSAKINEVSVPTSNFKIPTTGVAPQVVESRESVPRSLDTELAAVQQNINGILFSK